MKRLTVVLLLAGCSTSSMTQPEFLSDGDSYVTLIGTGDVHARCTASHASFKTAALVAKVPDAIVFTAGDNAGINGTPTEYGCFNQSWGQFRNRMHLDEGNHEHREDLTSTAYFDYGNGVGVDSGAVGRRGKGYYAYEVGGWRVLMLDSERAITEQVNWIQSLPEHRGCELAIWHKSLFVAGGGVGPTAGVRPLYRAVQNRGVDIVLTAHAHIYTRFPRLTYAGVRDTMAPQPFVVGTGGGILGQKDPYAPIAPKVNIVSHGVLKLRLYQNRYEWEFIDIGGNVRDSGSANCHA